MAERGIGRQEQSCCSDQENGGELNLGQAKHSAVQSSETRAIQHVFGEPEISGHAGGEGLPRQFRWQRQ